MIFAAWNISSLYREGSQVTALEKLSKYKLDLVGVQVRWVGGDIKPAEEYTFFFTYSNESHELDIGLSCA
jgi:hypothetical protein